MNPDRETTIVSIIAHNDDPWNALDIHPDIKDQHHLGSASSSATTSVISSRSAEFTSREPSVLTKLTSYGTNHLIYNDQDERKTIAAYTASLSASHGSVSGDELEHDEALHTTLSYMGTWSSGPQAQGQCLRKHDKARTRLSKDLPNRLKKPTVILHQSKPDAKSTPNGIGPTSLSTSAPIKQGT